MRIFNNFYSRSFQSQWIHAALTFALNEIRAINWSLAKDLYKTLRKRIEERRNVYLPPLNFLINPNKEFDIDKDLDMTLIKSKLKILKKKIQYHSTSIIAFQMRRTLLSLLKSYLQNQLIGLLI